MNPSFLAPTVGFSASELGATVPLVSSSNVFLTPASLGLQNVSMTALGQSIFLPPSYAVVPGQKKFTIRNSGQYPFGVRDAIGNLIASISGGGSVVFSLDSGQNWIFSGTNIDPGLITLDTTFSATFLSTVLLPFVVLDGNTSIHFINPAAGGFSAFVVDNLGKILTVPVVVNASSTGPVTAFKVSPTSAIVFYAVGGTASGVVLTLSGTSPALVLSVGTPTAFPASTNPTEDFSGPPKLIQLSSTLYLNSYSIGTTNTGVNALSVSGAVVTAGAAATIISSNGVNNSTTAYPLTATTALILYKSGAAAPFANNAVVISVAGVVSTVGTPTALAACASSVGTTPSSTLASPTKCWVMDDNNTTTVVLSGVTIAGTSVTAFTANIAESAITANLTYTGVQASRYNPHLYTLGGSSVLCYYYDSSTISRVLVATEAAGVITPGTKLYGNLARAAVGSALGGVMGSLGGTSEFVGIIEREASTGYFNTISAAKISGTTLTQGNSLILDISGDPGNLGISKLASGKYVVSGSGSTGSCAGITIFQSNGDVISSFGKINTPLLTLGSSRLPYQGTASNRMVVLGTTQMGTSVAPATFQLRLLNVEIAQ